MLRTVLSLIVVAFLAAGSAFSAGVTGIQLDYENNNTVATIQVSSPVQIAHQTVEAKDGKPFRVIIDILASVHQLGAMSFDNLPACPIQSIRSSQYSVDPERVVRIVFDMDGESIYRVDAAGNQVKVFFPDPNGKPFATWRSGKQLPAPPATQPKEQPVTVAKADPPKTEQPSATQVNKKIEQDRQQSLTAASKPAAQPAQAKATPKEQPTAASKEQPKAAPAQQSKPQPATAQVNLKPGETYGPTVDADVLAKVREDEARRQADAAKYAEMAKAQSQPKSAPQPEPVKPQAQPTQATAESKPAAQPQAKASTMTTAQAPEEKEEQSAPETSRFRRTPARSKQIAGTMVVEFPKRLTIKYGAGRHRDPFETLINESKTNDGPVAERVPNVEALRLVGVIESPDQGNRALFQDKDGYGYILKSGDKVERGVVLRVEADRVYFQIFEYGWSRTVALRLDSE